MKQSKFEISFSVESYDKKKLLINGQNCYVAEKHVVSKLSKLSISRCQNSRLIIEEIIIINFRQIDRQRALWSGRLIILNDKDGLKMHMKIYSHFPDFFKWF